MDVDDDDASQRPPPVDLAALERELDKKYLGDLSFPTNCLTSHADIPIDPEIIPKPFHFMFSSKASSTPSVKTKRKQSAQLPPTGGWVLMLGKILVHMRSVGRSLNVSFRGGDGKLGMTYTLPFV